jgi:hypothetical protein
MMLSIQETHKAGTLFDIATFNVQISVPRDPSCQVAPEFSLSLVPGMLATVPPSTDAFEMSEPSSRFCRRPSGVAETKQRTWSMFVSKCVICR